MSFYTFLFFFLLSCSNLNSFLTNDNLYDSFKKIFHEEKMQSLLFACIATILVYLVMSIVKIIFRFIANLFRKCKNDFDERIRKLEQKFDVDERIMKLEQRLDSDEMLEQKSNFDQRMKNLEQKLDYAERMMKLELRFDFDEKLEKKLENLGLQKGNKSENLKDIEFAEFLKKHKFLPNTKRTKFFIKGYESPIEIEIGKNNTVVQVKKRICSEIQSCAPYDYKIMKLSHDGQPLDDNKYFSSFKLSEDDQIFCEFDQNADPNDNVVIHLKGNVKLPKLIQIENYRKILYLRYVINAIEDISENCKIFIRDKINKNQLKEINNNTTIEECQLDDEDIMQIILGNEENLEITSIFNDDISIKNKISNVDLVSNLRKSIGDKLQFDPNELFLLLNDRMLSNDKFAFEYFTEKRAQVKYCKFMNLNDIEIDAKSLVKGTFGELFNAKIKANHMDILIKKYNVMIVAEMEDNSHIIRELKKFQITKSHPRFIQVLDLYKDDEYVFVAMENMSNGTLSIYLKTNPTVSENQIVMWSIQILEGLKFLNRNEIIHRDLNPKSIFLDNILHIKLSNFNLAKYSEFHHQLAVHKKIEQKARIPLRYVAPETITSEVCNDKTDVWSFGAIFLRIVTNKKPYWWIKKGKIINEFFANGCADYKGPYDVHGDKKKIIEMCMKGNSNERPTIVDLLKIPFFAGQK